MTDLEQSRLKTVRDHMALEITHEWDAVIDTFEHPRYELYGNGTVFDGEEAVRAEGQSYGDSALFGMKYEIGAPSS